jgi:hypothetical protein
MAQSKPCHRSATANKTFAALVLLAAFAGVAIAQTVPSRNQDDVSAGEHADVFARESLADDHCVGWRMSCKGASVRMGCTAEQLFNASLQTPVAPSRIMSSYPPPRKASCPPCKVLP